MSNYYVYYRVEAEKRGALKTEVQKLFTLIEKQTGVRGRWMRRRDDPSTYMEIYENVSDEKAFEAVLEREGAEFGVPRNAEVFISVVS